MLSLVRCEAADGDKRATYRFQGGLLAVKRKEKRAGRSASRKVGQHMQKSRENTLRTPPVPLLLVGEFPAVRSTPTDGPR